MTPRTYVPLTSSIPYEDLIEGHCYRFILRGWVNQPCAKLISANYKEVHGILVSMGSTGKGNQLHLDVIRSGGRGLRIYRAQILTIELPDSSNTFEL